MKIRRAFLFAFFALLVWQRLAPNPPIIQWPTGSGWTRAVAEGLNFAVEVLFIAMVWVECFGKKEKK